jgi:hypothetical protein
MTDIMKRALKLYDYALTNNLAGTHAELCRKIGIVPTNIFEIRSGKRGFTPEQLRSLLQLTNGSADWLFGFSTDMFRTAKKKKSSKQIFNEAVEMLREQIKP